MPTTNYQILTTKYQLLTTDD